jgi:hypothetical protein
MEQHIGFNEERDLERGNSLKPEMAKHLKKCVSCKMRVKGMGFSTKRQVSSLGPELSRWQRFGKWFKSIFNREKTS